MAKKTVNNNRKHYINNEEIKTLYNKKYNHFVFEAKKIIKDEDMIKDIINDAFVKLIKILKYKDIEYKQKYVLTIIKNDCLTYIKHKKILQNLADINEEEIERKF